MSRPALVRILPDVRRVCGRAVPEQAGPADVSALVPVRMAPVEIKAHWRRAICIVRRYSTTDPARSWVINAFAKLCERGQEAWCGNYRTEEWPS